MPEVRIFTLAILFRVLLLALERSLGIGAFFHVDSQYYLDHADILWSSGFDGETLWHYLTTNGYVLIVALFQALGAPIWGSILLNLVLSAAGLTLLFRVASRVLPECNTRAATASLLVIALLPYQAHLSIHILKDTVFIFFSIVLLWGFLSRRPVYTVAAALALLSIRSHLAVIEFLILAATVLLRNRFSWKRIFLLYMFGLGILAISGLDDRLVARGSVEFDGRSFFNSLPALRVSSLPDLVWMGIIAPLKSVLLPNILFARNFSELMYASEVTLTQGVLIFFLVKARICFACMTSPGGSMYLIMAIGGFWFVEITTPSYGPLVRYREFFWILFSFLTFYCFLCRFKLKW